MAAPTSTTPPSPASLRNSLRSIVDVMVGSWEKVARKCPLTQSYRLRRPFIPAAPAMVRRHRLARPGPAGLSDTSASYFDRSLAALSSRAPMASYLSIEALTVSYGGPPVLDRVSLDV